MKYLIFILFPILLYPQASYTGTEQGASNNDVLLYNSATGVYENHSRSAFQDTVGIRNFQSPAMYGVSGDVVLGVTDTAGRDDSAVFDSCFTNGDIVICDGGNYYVTTGFTIPTGKALIMNGSIIYASGNLTVATMSGTLSTTDTSSLKVNAGIGTYTTSVVGNKLVIYDASPFSAGDMIRIRSDSLSGSAKVGEYNTIRYVTGDTLYLDHSLYRTYTTDKNSNVALVTPVTSDVELNVIWCGESIDKSASTALALLMNYGYNCKIKLKARNFGYNSFEMNNSLNINYEPDIYNSRKTGYGYGTSINGCTDVRVSGTVIGAKHCITVGSAGNNQAMSWNIHISGVYFTGANPGGGSWALDSHAGTGSIFFENCAVYGLGTATDLGEISSAIGFHLGAAENYITNCYAEGMEYVVDTRDDSIVTIVVDGLIAKRSLYAVGILTTTGTDNLIMNNVYIPNGNLFYSAGRINRWSFTNLKGKTFGGAGITGTLPSSLETNGLELTNEAGSDSVALGFSFYGQNNQFSRVILKNFSIKGFNRGFYLNGDTVTTVILKNGFFENNLYNVALYNNSSVDNLVIENCTFGTNVGTGYAIFESNMSMEIDQVQAIGNQFIGLTNFVKAADSLITNLQYIGNIEGSSFAAIEASADEVDWIDDGKTIVGTIADDDSILIAAGKSGWGFVMVGDMQEYSTFYFTSAAAVTLGADATANVVNTDTDAKFVIYDTGTQVAIKNRLGSSLVMKYSVNYY